MPEGGVIGSILPVSAAEFRNGRATPLFGFLCWSHLFQLAGPANQLAGRPAGATRPDWPAGRRDQALRSGQHVGMFLQTKKSMKSTKKGINEQHSIGKKDPKLLTG